MSGRAGTAMPGAAITRWLVFFCLWMVLEGVGTVDLVVGAATAAAAAWVSLLLLPAAARRLRPLALARLVRCPLRLAPGPARSAFCAYSSLLPGTLVAGSEARALSLHCLDVGQDVTAQTCAEETAFLAAAGGARDG
jgi:multicomponent Na+:H+ antiporter subunit E